VTALIAILILVALTIGTIAFYVAPRLAVGTVVFDAVPDTPKPFGYRMAWLAIRSAETERVAAALGLEEKQPANWDSGLGTIYSDGLGDAYVFVSPPVKGWTFVAGVPLPMPAGRAFVDKLTPLLTGLSSEFSQVQYFAGYPVIDFFAWARLDGGRMVRAFAIGDEGVIWDRGKPTPEERALGLKLFDVRGIRGRKGDAGESIILHPTEEHVLRLARGWGLDPTLLDKLESAEGVGLVAHAPSAWRTQRIRKAA
jgi:hypothetical protein